MQAEAVRVRGRRGGRAGAPPRPFPPHGCPGRVGPDADDARRGDVAERAGRDHAGYPARRTARSSPSCLPARARACLFMLPAFVEPRGVSSVVVPLKGIRSDMIHGCERLGIPWAARAGRAVTDGASIVLVTPEQGHRRGVWDVRQAAATVALVESDRRRRMPCRVERPVGFPQAFAAVRPVGQV